ncbi:hypothetical protein HYALB_00012739 [Hymenoscyphus albidus]|uniref:Uncharacterized protein n=1 Tax=Hymenoscyphus albidus TaxID=595503 RepID=A0A9N9LP48_9HELO|nr:hypothetical protein HYALB_00012739 [Hymenoscyphus albidus]
MDVFYAYTYGTAGWMAIQAMPLIISPTVIIMLLSPEVREPSPLEGYFARSLGFSLLTLGLIIALLTGSIPLTSTTTSTAITTSQTDPKAPYAVPVLLISLLYHSTVAFYCYARYTTGGTFCFALGSVVSAALGSVALWCVMFASSGGRISRKTGADKRTSGWPFKNSESARERKKVARGKSG